jgi:hypothetical protein
MIALAAVSLAFVVTVQALNWNPRLSSVVQRFGPLLVLGAALTTACFVVAVYPIANSGFYGGGSDADDALDIAVRALLAGHYPYYERTYLGGEIAPMPSALVLASPFIILFGVSAWQNIPWLFVLAGLLAAYARRWTVAVPVFMAVTTASPLTMQQLATGGDRFTDAVAILLIAALADGTVRLKRVPWCLGALFAGLALTTRPNLILLAPLMLASVWRHFGRRRALSALFIALACAAAVTLPFWLVSPADFAPLTESKKLGILDQRLPGLGLLVITTTGLVGCLAGLWPRIANRLPLACALVQAIPITAGVVAGDLNLLSYGLFCMLLWAAASAGWLQRGQARHYAGQVARMPRGVPSCPAT